MSTPLPRGGGLVRARAPRALLAPLAMGLSLLTAGCGGGTDEPLAVPATVTVTAADPAPSVPVPPAAPSPATSAVEPTAAPAGDPARLPKQERGHDVAFVMSSTGTPDGTVLSIDRLTVVGVADEELAASGTPVRIDDGAQFTNQSLNLYQAGVSPQARFFRTTCTATPSGPTITSQAVDLETFLAVPGLSGTAVTLAYVDGLVDRAETNPRC